MLVRRCRSGQIASLSILTSFLALLLLGCGDGGVEPQPVHRELTQLEKQLVNSGNDFSFKLFRKLVEMESREEQQNIFVSPFSVSMSLGMVYNGAAGETKTAMEECLTLSGMSVEEINQSYQSLIDFFTQLDHSVTVDVANSIWYRQDMPFRQEFLDLNQEYFDAEVAGLNFSDPRSVNTINDWVSSATNGRIPTIVDEIYSNEVIFLVNAIYFKGDWTTIFEDSRTKPISFTKPDSTTVTVNGMHMSHAPMKFMANDDVTGLQMPYGDGDFAMTLLMPLEGVDIDALLANLDEQLWQEIQSSMRAGKNDIMVPRFRLSYSLKLNDVLSELGMEVAFDADRADFDGMCEECAIYLSRVMHKTFVQVDEKGTEAAAATSSSGAVGAAPPMWIFNRPFIYVIHTTNPDVILFMGKMVEPVWE